MKFWILLVVSFLSTPVLLFSQIGDLSPVAKSADNNNRQTRAVLMGKVSIEEASASTEATEVILECGSRARAHTYSDGRGTFSITVSVGGPLPNAIGQPKDGVISHEDWASCELYGDLAGYASERIRLFGDPDTGIVDVGTIVLHPTAQQQQHGFTVSLTSLAAPDKAKKAFEKGQEQVKKGKWAAACDYFKKAVAEYPRFALAWLELGRAQVKQNSFAEAHQSFRQAVTEDSKFVDGYQELARLALQQQQWKELAEVTDHLVQFRPDAGPEYWFLNSAANFNLGNMKPAEASITHGLRLDPKHQLPQMEYLYGLILAKSNDYKAAADHVSTYLRLAPHAHDAEAAQKVLTEFQKQAEVEAKK